MTVFLRGCFGALLLLATAAPPALATTVIEKNLDALCAEADLVFVGTVTSVQSQWADAEQGSIDTAVTFGDIEPLFGVGGPEVTLHFSGGQVGGVIEQIPGMPVFTVGERAVLFARNGRYVSPLVGLYQGRLPVSGQGDAATVKTTSYERLGTLADGRRIVGEAPQATTTVPLPDFVAEVRQRLMQRGGAAQ
jgi:hypothetical protein